MSKTLEGKIDNLTDAIQKLISNPVAVVAPVAPVLPIAPVAPVLPVNTGDHDFLLTFSSEVKIKLDNINDNIKNLTDGTSTKINMLENKAERNTNDITIIKTYGSAFLIVLGLAEIILKFVVK